MCDTVSAPMTYRFGDFEVDAAAYEVRRGGTRVRLTRQPMEILLLLLERRQGLVSREEMAKRLWKPDVFTDPDAGIHTAILRIRQALGDSREGAERLRPLRVQRERVAALRDETVLTHHIRRD